MPEQMFAETENIENHKCSDALLEEFNLELVDLGLAIVEFKLDENQDVKKFRSLIQMQQHSEHKKAIDACAMPNEMVDNMCREAASLGAPEVKADGTFTFEYFCKSQNLVMSYWFRYAKP